MPIYMHYILQPQFAFDVMLGQRFIIVYVALCVDRALRQRVARKLYATGGKGVVLHR